MWRRVETTDAVPRRAEEAMRYTRSPVNKVKRVVGARALMGACSVSACAGEGVKTGTAAEWGANFCLLKLFAERSVRF
eukprot:2814011-Pleurochrysis_carterae.AAC.4